MYLTTAVPSMVCLSSLVTSVFTLTPQNSITAKMLDLLFQFNLIQSVSQATSDDNIVRSTSVTSAIASDHLCVISHLKVAVPCSPPSFVMARNISASDCTALKDDLRVRTLTVTCGVLWTNTLQACDGKSLLTGVVLCSQLSVRKIGLPCNKEDLPRDSG